MIRLMALLLVFAAGCVPLQTDSIQDLTTEFSNFETFGWLDSNALPGEDVRVRDERVQQTVRDAIEQTLIQKGYRKTDTDQADFVVAWYGAIEKKIRNDNLDHLYPAYGYGALLRDKTLNPDSPQPVAEYEEGTLIIDLLDPKNQRMLWRGTGVGPVINDRPVETALKNLANSVARVLDPIPSH